MFFRAQLTIIGTFLCLFLFGPEIRLWACEGWIEVDAPSLDIAIPIAQDFINKM